MRLKAIKSSQYEGLVDTLVLGMDEEFNASIELQKLSEDISKMTVVDML